MIRIAVSTLVGIALGLPAAAAARPQVRAGGVASSQVLRPGTLTKQQFDEQLKRSPEGAVIESGGQRKTKAEVRAMAAQRGQTHLAKAEAALAQAKASFEQRRLEIERQHQAKLEADGGKAKAEFDRLR
jgi:hypothetical protein